MPGHTYLPREGIVIYRRQPSKTRPEDVARAEFEEIAVQFPQTPQEDLIFRGGKVIPDLFFKNFYLGTQYWSSEAGKKDRTNIDLALASAMSDIKLNNVVMQYFGNNPISSTMLPSTLLPVELPATLAKSQVRQFARNVFQAGQLTGLRPDRTVVNFMLPPGIVLSSDETAGVAAAMSGIPSEDDEEANSLEGLGGYHGSVHITGGGSQRVTLYYAVGVYSQLDPANGDNGIPIPGWEPWMNVVATFYHELVEARTDPDVEDAIRQNDVRFIGWNSDRGQEIGDFPITEAGRNLRRVFLKVPLADGSGEVPIQLMYSNAVHGPQGPVDAPLPVAGALAALPGGVPTAAAAAAAAAQLAHFSPPGRLEDFADPELLAAWSDFISNLFDQGVARTQEFLEGRPSQFHNPVKTASAGNDEALLPILWQGFPKSIERTFGTGTTRAWRAAEEIVGTRVARQQFQDEYLEWHVHRDPDTNKIISVDFTCEGPEYWSFLGENAPDILLELYQTHINPDIRKQDLFHNGVYDPLNPWNLSRGAMHLIQPNNTLSAEIFIAADATILRRNAAGNIITDAAELISCAGFGERTRASDPHIGDEVNGLARQGRTITLPDPVGLYIDALNTTGWTKPDGTPVGDYFKITRGSRQFAVRAVYKVPEDETANGEPFVVGDILIGGAPIQFGGQIAKHVTMRLTGSASGAGSIANPAFGCGGPMIAGALVADVMLRQNTRTKFA